MESDHATHRPYRHTRDACARARGLHGATATMPLGDSAPEHQRSTASRAMRALPAHPDRRRRQRRFDHLPRRHRCPGHGSTASNLRAGRGVADGVAQQLAQHRGNPAPHRPATTDAGPGAIMIFTPHCWARRPHRPPPRPAGSVISIASHCKGWRRARMRSAKLAPLCRASAAHSPTVLSRLRGALHPGPLDLLQVEQRQRRRMAGARVVAEEGEGLVEFALRGARRGRYRREVGVPGAVHGAGATDVGDQVRRRPGGGSRVSVVREVIDVGIEPEVQQRRPVRGQRALRRPARIPRSARPARRASRRRAPARRSRG